MSLNVIYPQWRDQRRYDRGPFSDRAEVPDGLNLVFVDAALYVCRAGGPLWLRALTVANDRVAVEVSDGAALAAGAIARGAADDVIRLTAPTGQPAGVLVGAAAGFPDLFALRQGRTEYTRAQTEFAVGVTVPMPSLGVLSLSAGGDPLAGAVTLVGEHGVRLGLVDGEVAVTVRGVAMDDGVDGTGGRGLRTINHIAPDDRGEFKFAASVELAADSALRLASAAGSLTFSVIGS
jgi:hypothetical protein